MSEETSKDFSLMNDFTLTSLQLVTMEAIVKMSSNKEVEVKATMKDISLSDLQPENQGKVTG